VLQAPNPFSRQAGTDERMDSATMSDPGGMRQSLASGQLPGALLPPAPSLHQVFSTGAGSSNPSDVSTSLTTLSSEGSRNAPPQWQARMASDSHTTTSGESARTTEPLPWSAGNAGASGGGGSGGAAEDIGRAADRAVAELRRRDSGFSQGAMQVSAAAEPSLPDASEGGPWSVHDLAARQGPSSSLSAHLCLQCPWHSLCVVDLLLRSWCD
jgi:hypothetical protein